MSAGDLLYAEDDRAYADEMTAKIKAEFPNAQTNCHHDGIKGWRVEINIDGCEQETFWRFAIREKFALDLLAFQLEMRTEPDHIRQLMAAEGIDVSYERKEGDS